MSRRDCPDCGLPIRYGQGAYVVRKGKEVLIHADRKWCADMEYNADPQTRYCLTHGNLGETYGISQIFPTKEGHNE